MAKSIDQNQEGHRSHSFPLLCLLLAEHLSESIVALRLRGFIDRERRLLPNAFQHRFVVGLSTASTAARNTCSTRRPPKPAFSKHCRATVKEKVQIFIAQYALLALLGVGHNINLLSFETEQRSGHFSHRLA